jgi:hypothetical protein
MASVAKVTVEQLIDGAERVATLDAEDHEIAGGWTALARSSVAAQDRPVTADAALVRAGLEEILRRHPTTARRRRRLA